MCRTFEVVELPAAYRPPEYDPDQKREHNRKGNEQKKDVHDLCRLSLQSQTIALSKRYRLPPALVSHLQDPLRFSGTIPGIPYLARRKALPTTSRELADIPIAAIHGVMYPAIASGIAMRLYAMAQPRFCLTTRMVRLA